MQNRNIVSKSFTFRGENGNHLTVSETEKRDAIVVSIYSDEAKFSVRLNAHQFTAMCAMDSKYDGLEVEVTADEVAA